MLRRTSLTASVGCVFALYAACSNQSPDQIRQRTAEETAAIKRDSKAVAEGLRDGLSNRHAVDLNKSTKNDLTSLPGITTTRPIASSPSVLMPILSNW